MTDKQVFELKITATKIVSHGVELVTMGWEMEIDGKPYGHMPAGTCTMDESALPRVFEKLESMAAEAAGAAKAHNHLKCYEAKGIK